MYTTLCSIHPYTRLVPVLRVAGAATSIHKEPSATLYTTHHSQVVEDDVGGRKTETEGEDRRHAREVPASHEGHARWYAHDI